MRNDVGFNAAMQREASGFVTAIALLLFVGTVVLIAAAVMGG